MEVKHSYNIVNNSHEFKAVIVKQMNEKAGDKLILELLQQMRIKP